MSTNWLLTRYDDSGNNWLKFERQRAIFAVWVNIIGTKMDLYTAGDGDLYLLLFYGLYFLTSCGFRTRLGPERSEPRVFMQVSGTEPISQLVYPTSHFDIHCAIASKKKLIELLRLEEGLTSAFAVFVRHGTCRVEDMAGVSLRVYCNTLIWSL